MKGRVRGLARTVPDCCSADRCDRDDCKVSLAETPPERVLIDMDCRNHQIQDDQKRCDYLFIGEENNTRWVAPIELKSGRVKSVTAVRNQLEGGAKVANGWLRKSIPFKFVPVLVHGKSIHPFDIKRLRAKKIQLRGKKVAIALLRCGGRLVNVLPRDTDSHQKTRTAVRRVI